MNSLVGYGVSSESDSDGEHVGELGGEASAVKKTRNFLLESGSASSESEPEDGDPEPSSSPPRPRKSASSTAHRPAPPPGSLACHKLPPPALNTSSDSGVFANPFKAQADQKLSALQKHVPLTMQPKPSQIGGKKVCVSYRKNGRCRFGIKCKFAHDSDLQNLADGHASAAEETPGSGQAEPRAGGSRGRGSKNPRQKKEEGEESGGQQVKRRKVGLSNTLIPPKRAMKQYATQRGREQMNMS